MRGPITKLVIFGELKINDQNMSQMQAVFKKCVLSSFFKKTAGLAARLWTWNLP